jgi:ATP phosphoribosyltransferase regulatory subunit
MLDVYGEDLRARAFILDEHRDARFCLRPDFTVPIAMEHLELQKQDYQIRKRYCYAGAVFRRAHNNSPQPRQILQSGIEIYESGVEADVTALESCLVALRRVGITDVKIRIGDLGILFAILDSIRMPDRWRRTLQRHIWRPAYFQKILQQYSYAHNQNNQTEHNLKAFLKCFGNLDTRTAQQAIQHIFTLSNTPHQGSRSIGDIARRFIGLSQETQYRPLEDAKIKMINDFLALRCPAEEVVDKITELTRDSGVSIRGALERFEQRAQKLPPNCEFDASFGRNLEYYDGFVFDINFQGKSLAGGGRYDRLFNALGSITPCYGVGAALRLSDIEKVLQDD